MPAALCVLALEPSGAEADAAASLPYEADIACSCVRDSTAAGAACEAGARCCDCARGEGREGPGGCADAAPAPEAEAVRRRYRQLSVAVHPDKCTHPDAEKVHCTN